MYYAKRERESDNVDQGESMHMGKKRDRKREQIYPIFNSHHVL